HRERVDAALVDLEVRDPIARRRPPEAARLVELLLRDVVALPARHALGRALRERRLLLRAHVDRPQLAAPNERDVRAVVARLAVERGLRRVGEARDRARRVAEEEVAAVR